jgi:AcrR family transcriptional regulator
LGIQERKEREKEARNAEILRAAESVFLEKGLQAATMDEIAARAELGKATLYLYYRSKEDLYLAVMMKGSAILYDMFVAATSTGEPPLKLILNLGEAYYQYFKEHRNYFRMYYFFENAGMHTQVSPEMKSRCFENDKKIWDLVIGLITAAIRAQDLRSDLEPFQAAVMLWANANGLMRQMDRMGEYWRTGMNIDLDSTLRLANTLLLQGMMTEKGKEEFAAFSPVAS